MSDNIHLLIIDPQNDFCQPSGSLYVPGAEEDIQRLTRFLDTNAQSISQIHLSLDSHHVVDISHPAWFVDVQGEHPAPFTSISVADLESGAWRCTDVNNQEPTVAYLKELQSGKRYPHIIWPEHCLIGSTGHGVVPELLRAMHRWERQNGQGNYLWKGQNPVTEHFSVIQAEVPSLDHPETQANMALVAELEGADHILVAGQALSHCVANTVRDLVARFDSVKSAKKITLLRDCTSSVGGFEDLGEQFVADMTRLGMRCVSSGQLSL